jgi:hypothetical protein
VSHFPPFDFENDEVIFGLHSPTYILDLLSLFYSGLHILKHVKNRSSHVLLVQ